MSDIFSEEYLESNWKEWYLALQGVFYFAQGVAFVAILVLPLFMQNVMGMSADRALSLYGTILLPWGVKVIYGLLSDNVSIGKFGRRKPYLVIAGILGAVGWIALPFFADSFGLFLFAALIVSISTALADATLDSLAVDVTPQKRRGAMQAVGWGMRGAGMALSGFVLGIFMNLAYWKIIYILPGSFMIVTCFVVLLFPENSNLPFASANFVFLVVFQYLCLTPSFLFFQ